ncbi:MAG TPA: MAPEG family protein [Afifellaceae bacterium]|nr:MAPEG family protein [Afifellaceae bacterium]
MTVELQLLAASAFLGLVHIILAAQAANLQRGFRWGGGPRDEAEAPLAGIGGRLERAQRNFLETFPLFAAAVLVAHAAGEESWMTALGAHLYFWARLAYVPAYVSGVFLVRSLIWNVATVGILLVLIAPIIR